MTNPAVALCSGITGIAFFCLTFFAVRSDGTLWAVSFATFLGVIGAVMAFLLITLITEWDT